jgi:Arm DNA-binding domain
MADEMAFTTTRPPRRRYTYADPELIGHYVRVLPTGVKSFLTVARDPFGKQVWTTIGRCDRIKIEASREKAREIIRRVKAGKPAFEPEPPKADTLAAVGLARTLRRPQRAADATRDRAPSRGPRGSAGCPRHAGGVSLQEYERVRPLTVRHSFLCDLWPICHSKP